jgi:hypothetical protein
MTRFESQRHSLHGVDVVSSGIGEEVSTMHREVLCQVARLERRRVAKSDVLDQ